METNRKIKPIAVPGIHPVFLKFFEKNTKPKSKVLDAGTGHGAIAEALYQLGYDVIASDLNQTIYHCKNVPFVFSDITKSLPFGDEQFDAVAAVEVMEHISDHEVFFSEVARVLKQNGKLFISTPNILSLKSRWKFLFSGYFYSFGKLDYKTRDGLQHISSLTIDQYAFIADNYGLSLKTWSIDKKQNSSRWLMIIYPLLKVYGKLKSTGNYHNQINLLLGRVLLLMFEKESV